MTGSDRYLHKMDQTEKLLKNNFTDRPRVAGSRDSVVGIAIGWTSEGLKFESR
jgi:hypothetical protein